MQHLQALSFLCLAISFLASGQNTEIREGIIQGVVLDDVGNPVSGAKVHAELKGVPMAKAIRFVKSDQNGFFLIDRLEFGTYYVAAMKEEDGYGDFLGHSSMTSHFPPSRFLLKRGSAMSLSVLGQKPES